MGVSSLLDIFHNHLGEFIALASAFCSTLSVLAWTSTSRCIGVIAVGCLRLTSASILLSILARFSSRGLWFPTDLDQRTWIYMALSGIFGYFVADLLGIKSLVVIGPRLTLLLQALLPVFVTALAFFFNNESLATIQLLGIAVTLLGIIWVVLEQPQSPKEIRHRKKFALGVISAVASAVFAALGIFFAKKVMAGTDPLAATQLRILAGLACYPFLLTFLRRWRQVGQAACNFRAMIILQLGTIIGPVIAMILYMDALKTCPSMGIATTILSLTPIMILPFSVLVYKEKVSPRAVFGAILSAVGVMLMMC